MTTLRIAAFSGLIPRLGRRGLPDNAALIAVNTKLVTGELTAWWEPLIKQPIADFPAITTTAATIATIPLRTGDYLTYLFPQRAEVALPPLIAVADQRFYYTSETTDGVRVVETAAWPSITGVRAGAPPFTAALTGNAAGGVSAITESRVYVLTWESEFGEIGVPSPTMTLTGKTDATWTINTTPAPADITDYNVTHVSVWRTITSSTGVDYRRVARVAYVPGAFSYADTVPSTTVAAALLLESFNYYPPPDGLRGLVAMANGMMAGFVDDTVYFSEAYRPYAWPDEYQIAVGSPIVALAPIGNSVVVLTKESPVVLTGTTPASVSMTRVANNYSCLDARSVVNMGSVAVYSSQYGLVSVSEGGFQLLTENYADRDEWVAELRGDALNGAARYQNRYLGFGPMNFAFDTTPAFVSLTTFNPPHDIDCVCNGPNGELLYATADGVYEWEGYAFGDSLEYTWRSKTYITPKPVNFAALQLRGAFVTLAPNEAQLDEPPYDGFELNTLMINGTDTLGGGIGGPAYPPINDFLLTVSSVAVKLYGDRVLRWSGTVTDSNPVRLPDGYKCTEWEIQFEGKVSLHSAVVATTMKELEQVP